VCGATLGASPAPISPVETSTTAIAIAPAPIKELPAFPKLGNAAPRNANTLLDSENDPPWPRPIESNLLYYIQGQPEISTMEVARIVCRRSGCEIRVLDSFESAMPGPADEARGWQAVVQRLVRDEQFRDQLDSPSTSLHVQGDRILYISTLRRIRFDAPRR
jgi:hypothetical protein